MSVQTPCHLESESDLTLESESDVSALSDNYLERFGQFGAHHRVSSGGVGVG